MTSNTTVVEGRPGREIEKHVDLMFLSLLSGSGFYHYQCMDDPFECHVFIRLLF